MLFKALGADEHVSRKRGGLGDTGHGDELRDLGAGPHRLLLCRGDSEKDNTVYGHMGES